MHKIKFYVILIILGFSFVSISENIDLTETEDLFSIGDNQNDKQLSILEQDPQSIAITVNGQEIPLGLIQQNMIATLQRFQGQFPPEQLPSIEKQLYKDSKDRIINLILINEAITEEAIIPSEEDVNERFAYFTNSIVNSGTTLDDFLTMQGITVSNILNEIRNSVAIDELVALKTSHILNCTDAEAEEFYVQNPQGFLIPETIEASHILLQFKDGDNDDIKASKKNDLLNIRNKILSGELSFEDAAKEFSDCPSGKRDSGSLGVFRKGSMVPDFEIAAFSQEIGEIGDVIETQFGYHIIKKINHTFEEKREFNDVKEVLKQQLKEQKITIAFNEYTMTLREKANIEELLKL